MVKTKIGEFVPVLTPIHSLRSIPFGSERRERTALGSDDRREEKSAEGRGWEGSDRAAGRGKDQTNRGPRETTEPRK